MNKDNEIKDKTNQVAARIYFPHEDPMLPAESVWLEAERWPILSNLLEQEMVDRCCAQAEMDVYTRWEGAEKDWTFKFRKTYINLFYYPDYMFLTPNDKVWRNCYDCANRLCVHVPSGTCFHIFRRNNISFGDSVFEDRRNIFYKFSYTGEDGTVTPMIIHTRTKELLDDDEIRHIKYDILKNGAKWFCEHLQNGGDGVWFGDKAKPVF